MKKYFAVLVALLVIVIGSSKLVNAQSSASKPNIVFFLADDMGLGDTSAYQDLSGNSDAYQLDTPNMERLATMGLRFIDAHSGAAVCTPTRLSLMTGTHSFRSPIKQRTSFVNQDNIASLLPGKRNTFAHMLRDSGYGTYGVGKWHIGLQADYAANTVFDGPLQAGFDHYTGTPGNFPGDQGIVVDDKMMGYDASFNLVDFDSPDAILWVPASVDNNGVITGNPAITEQIQQTNLDAAKAYLAAHVATRSNDPFLLYYASHANHTPFIGSATLDGVTVDGHTKACGYLDVPTTTDASGDIIPTGSDYGDVGLSNHWIPYLQTDTSGNVTQHGPGERFECVDENDIALGKLLDFLENTDDPRNPGHKLIANTLVVFTSDNGSDIKSEPSVGALPQSSNGVITDISGKKATQEEGGTRVPFIAAWAGQIAAGQTTDALIGLNDIYATVAEIVGHDLSATEALDSESALSALTGTATGDFRGSRLVYKNRHRLIIRDGDLKLIAEDPDYNSNGSDRFDGDLDFADLTATRLFDLSTDLSESNNLINDSSYAATRDSLLATLQSYVDQGFSRTGAAPVSNGQNFQGGGSVLDVANYLYYGDGSEFEPDVLTLNAPSFIYLDGDSPQRISEAWIVQGNGAVTMTGTAAGIDDGTVYELRGGSLVSTTKTFLVNDGASLRVNGGDVDLTGQKLRLNKADGSIEFGRGSIIADQIAFEDLNGSTAGEKTLRFLAGVDGGTLTLTSSNPLDFGAAHDPLNDYVDFESGWTGEILSVADASYFQSLWNGGKLRVDGQTGTALPADLSDYFSFADAGNGFYTMTMVEESSALVLGDVNLDGVVDFLDISPFIAVLSGGGFQGEADCDENGAVDFLDISSFIAILSGSGS